MDLAEYTDGMNTYGFSSDYSHEAFKLFAVVSALLLFVKIIDI